MTMIPAQESAYRLKVRRRLTLDLFTRYGTFWEQIQAMRTRWHIVAEVAVPPSADYRPQAQASALMLKFETFASRHNRRLIRDGMAATPNLTGMKADDFTRGLSSLFLPAIVGHAVTIRPDWDEPAFMEGIHAAWKRVIARPGSSDGDWRDGANVTGWLSWAPFLTACVVYDPPASQLLEYAEYEDAYGAVFAGKTFSRDGSQLFPSTRSDTPTGKRGRPSEPLQDVQCAIWRGMGMSSADIGRRIDRSVRDNSDAYELGDPSHRERSDAAEDAVRRGRQILEERQAQIITE